MPRPGPEQQGMDLWQKTRHGTLPGTIADVRAEEQAALMPLPVAFDGFIELSRRVSPPRCLAGDTWQALPGRRYLAGDTWQARPGSAGTGPGRGRISFERNRYSVPASFANRPVSLPICPDRRVVAAAGNMRQRGTFGRR